MRYLKHKRFGQVMGEFEPTPRSANPGKHFLRFFRHFGEVMTQKDIG